MAPECCGSITTDTPPPLRGRVRTNDNRCRFRPDRVEQFGPGEKHYAGAGQRQQYSTKTWVRVHVMPAAFDCTDGDGIDDQPRLGTGLDHEQAGDTLQHGNH